MSNQQAQEFVNLVAAMQTSEENAAAQNCDMIGVLDELIATARQIAEPPRCAGCFEPITDEREMVTEGAERFCSRECQQEDRAATESRSK